MNGFPRGPLVTVLFLYLTAIVLYQIAPADTVTQEFWEVWSTQVTALLLVSLIAGAVALRIRTGPIRATIVGAQIAIFALGVYGEAAFSIALFAWGAALIVQTFVLVSYRTAIVLSTVMIATAIFLPRADTVWNVAVADRQAVDIVAGLTFFGLVLYLTATSTASMRRAEEYLQSREQHHDDQGLRRVDRPRPPDPAEPAR
jgi:membrane-bound ClpP family serine protease